MTDTAINKWFLVAILVLAQALYGVVCMGVGQWIAVDTAKQAAAEMLGQRRVTPVQRHDPFAEYCRSKTEYHRMCNARRRAI